MKKLTTLFAPPERAAAETIASVHRQLVDLPFLSKFVDSMPGGLLVLNPERQIVFVNRSLLDLAGVNEQSLLLGKRPGELLRCEHADENPAGCGTTEFCKTCGAVKAILASQQGNADIQECRLLRKPDGEALDLRVWATPFRVNELALTIFALLDISNEKRRKALERIFFHDILNTASGVKGFAELLEGASMEDVVQYKGFIATLSRMMVDEINSQRTLTAAENNELTITPVAIRSLDLLQDVIALFQNHEVARDRMLRLDSGAQAIEWDSDRVLLTRVIGNMVKNALEAVHPGETVTVGCAGRDRQIEFWVHNPNQMPRDVQLQIFQRSFSTKGAGRGLGTYSIKLLSERYLQGTVSFSSTAEGTTFRAIYPLKMTAL